MFLVSVLVCLDVFTTVATKLYLYFQGLASVDKGTKSCDMLSRKQILSAPTKYPLKISRSTF